MGAHIGVLREAIDNDGQAQSVSSQRAQRWVHHAQRATIARDLGHPSGRCVFELIVHDHEEGRGSDLGNLMRQMADEAVGEHAF